MASPEGPHDPAGRLFLGVAVPAAVRDALDHRLRSHLRDRPLPGRPVPPANWHLTLRFLGATPRARLELIRRELHAEPLGPPFRLALGAHGAFPRASRASVLWVGVADGAEVLARLAATVEAAVRRAGVPPDERRFHAHLTLSRLQPPRDVRRLLDELPSASAAWVVDEVVLFRSHLGQGPARYEALERFALRG